MIHPVPPAEKRVGGNVPRPFVRPAWIWDRDDLVWTRSDFYELADGTRHFTPVTDINRRAFAGGLLIKFNLHA
jgi:hypothetical protein